MTCYLIYFIVYLNTIITHSNVTLSIGCRDAIGSIPHLHDKNHCPQFTEVLDVFPKSEIVESEAYFCLPKGALLEVWPSTISSDPKPVFSTFVLTSSSGVNVSPCVFSLPMYMPISLLMQAYVLVFFR